MSRRLASIALPVIAVAGVLIYLPSASTALTSVPDVAATALCTAKVDGENVGQNNALTLTAAYNATADSLVAYLNSRASDEFPGAGWQSPFASMPPATFVAVCWIDTTNPDGFGLPLSPGRAQPTREFVAIVPAVLQTSDDPTVPSAPTEILIADSPARFNVLDPCSPPLVTPAKALLCDDFLKAPNLEVTGLGSSRQNVARRQNAILLRSRSPRASSQVRAARGSALIAQSSGVVRGPNSLNPGHRSVLR